jgi:putative ABC transport system permease protein
MRSLRGIAWRGLRRRPLRSGLTIAGIALGVGLVFAALAVNAGVDAAVAATVRDSVGTSDITVRSIGDTALPATVQASVREAPGVVEANASVQRRTFVSSLERGLSGQPVLLVGIEPDAARSMHDFRLASGSFLAPSDDGGVLLPAAWAAERGIGLGESVSFQGPGGQPSFVVTGFLAAVGPAATEQGRIAFVTRAAAAALYELGDGVTTVELRVEPVAGVDAVNATLAQRLTGQPYETVATRDVLASLGSSTREFQWNTLLIAAVALFVGGFLIFNTLSMTVAERIREIGLLRAAGATSRQVNALFIEEALVLGVIGTVLGLAVGVLIAAGMSAAIRAARDVPAGDAVFWPGPLLVSVVLGVLVTVIAALEPARRAGGIPPVEALRARGETQVGGVRVRWLVAMSLAMALAMLLVLPASVTGPDVVARPFAVFGLLIVAALGAPLVLGVVGRLAGGLFGRVLRAEGTLARGALARDRGRTAVTLGALVIGLAMVVAVAAVADNARRASTAWLEAVVPGEHVATAITPIPADFASDFAAVQGVASVSAMRTFDVEAVGRRVDALAVDPAVMREAGSLVVLGTDRGSAFDALAGGRACLVPDALAGALGAGVGGTIQIRTVEGDVPFRVAGLVARSYPGNAGEAIIVSLDDASSLLGASDVNLFAIRSAAGAPASLGADLAAVGDQYALEVVRREDIASAIGDSLSRVFGLFDALALMAVLVAALGIANTLTMDVYERIREIGVLRAAGMTRTQVWRMVVLEAGLLGVAGAVVGVVSGLVIGFVTLLLERSPGFEPPFDIPWVVVLLASVLGIGVAVLAAAYPARVASRLPIVRAFRFE